MKTEKSCYAVIFTGQKSEQTEGYNEAAMAMFELAMKQPGFISIEHSQMDKKSITVSYWDSLEAIQKWKNHPDHQLTQEKGKNIWYENYTVKVVKVLREYSFKQ